MKTLEEKIAVMQAFADGKKIEFLNVNGEWTPASKPTWDWGTYDYRVKHEPRVIWVNEYLGTTSCGIAYSNELVAKEASITCTRAAVRYVESP